MPVKAPTSVVAAVLAGLPSVALAGSLCPTETGPDVIVGNIGNFLKWGTVGDITAYSFATTSCNIGDEPLPWIAVSNQHPVIAQHLYRLKDGRMEQIGIAWLKHGWGALADNFCCTCQNPGDFELLGVGCSDPYCASLNGDQDGLFGGTQAGLGPRSEVDAATGAFLWPYGSQGVSGDAIYKRLQVHNDDLDPALNAGAQYFAECQYVTPHDAAAGNQNNNATYREVVVGGFKGGGWGLGLTGASQPLSPAIQAWQDVDPAVMLTPAQADGLFILGSKATDNGDGTWHYEYALYNMNSHRSAGSFSVPLPAGATITGMGFHDVDYHSGEPYDGEAWSTVTDAGSLTWSTKSFDVNPNANALRWGTLYNFRLDVDVAPARGNVEVGLFRPGSPDSIMVAAEVPGPFGPCVEDISGEGEVEIQDLLALLAAWGACPGCPEDFNDDGSVDIVDLLQLLAAWGPC